MYPALAVLQALNAERSGASFHAGQAVETLWVGSEGGMEAELLKRAGVSFTSVPAAGMHGVGLRALPRNLIQLARGLLAARKILHDFRPDVLFFTGGYVAAPMALVGRRVPTLLYVPDIEPGLALKSLARFADRIAVSSEDTQKYFDQRVITTGYPIRAELTSWTKQKGRMALDLDTNAPVLLVFGGSKGARSINQTVMPNLPTLLEMTQVLHVTGQLDWEAVELARAGLTSGQKRRYRAFPYLHGEMGAALAAADLAVARAGASTLGELPFFGLPAVLVPYPHAWRYQKVNADYLAQRGAAVIVEDRLLQKELLTVVKALLENPAKREAMRAAMVSLAHPRAAVAIAEQLLELGGQRQ